MISARLLQMLFIPMLLFSFIPVAFATDGCPIAMLEMRLNGTDYSNLQSSLNISGSIPYNLTYLCRAHSFTAPTWVTNVIVTVSFGSYFALLQYECNASTTFSAPTTLINATVYNHTIHSVYKKNDSNPDFCYNCVNDSSKQFCESCHSNCSTSKIYDLNFCYGPNDTQCCNYIQDNSCVSQCNATSYPNANSLCTLCGMDCGNKTLSNTSCECVCGIGYSGDQCDLSICDSNPCQNGGNCSITGTLAQPNTSCACPTGYDGTYCNVIVNPCLSGPCNNGTCNMTNTTSYTCTCNSGYIGSDCSYPDPCFSETQCNNNGGCTTTESMPYFVCNCTGGVTGDNCQYNQHCTNTTGPCMNSGQCTANGANNYNCTCTTGYTGDDCEESISPVSSSPAAAIAAVLIVLIIVIVIVIILVVLLGYFFYVKPKKGKVEISKKTSKVHPTNGDNGATGEKVPILEEHKH